MQAIIFDLDHTLFDTNNALHEGVHDLLVLLKRLGVRVGGLTSGDHRVLVRLDEAGIREFFASVLCADHVAAPKVVGGVEYLLELLGVRPHETTMVSHAYSDILLGRDARLKQTVAVSHGVENVKILNRSQADHVVKDIPGVLDVLA